MFGLGTKEIVIVAVLFILLFGPKKIPALAKSIKEAINHLRGALKEEEPVDEKLAKEDTTKKEQ
ncbi:MAG: twin-arginine translocase TatA/TatE family subunit [Candidatus Magasanikbacteria bacterium]|nr:twin-arginine translocase TatA/TatE family subunit [Candidatus Magasanikbacteria bacterium]